MCSKTHWSFLLLFWKFSSCQPFQSSLIWNSGSRFSFYVTGRSHGTVSLLTRKLFLSFKTIMHTLTKQTKWKCNWRDVTTLILSATSAENTNSSTQFNSFIVFSFQNHKLNSILAFLQLFWKLIFHSRLANCFFPPFSCACADGLHCPRLTSISESL